MEKVLENNRVSVSSVISTATTQMCRRRLTVRPAGCQVTGFDVVDEIDRSILGDILPPVRAGSQPGTAIGHGEKCAAVHITVDVGGVPPDVQRHDGAVRHYRYDLDVIVLHEWIFKHLCNVLFLHKEPLLFDCGTTLYETSWTVFIIIAFSAGCKQQEV